MDIKKFKVKFQRIESLLKIIDTMGEANEVEADLLKVYLQDLIAVIDEGKEPKENQPKVITKQEVILDIEKEKSNEIPVSIAEEVKSEVENVVPPKSIEVVKEKAAVTAPEPPKESKVQISEPEPEVTINVEKAKNTSSDFGSLFESIEAKEVSDRLSLTKVTDIGKAMGINEKIFTVKELFGGNQSLFESTVAKLNACVSFDEATDFLKNEVANELDWMEAGKFKKAKKFIKLVQRRFV